MEPDHDTVMDGTDKSSILGSNFNPDNRNNTEGDPAPSATQRTHYPRAMSVDLPEPTTGPDRDRMTGMFPLRRVTISLCWYMALGPPIARAKIGLA